MRIPPAKPDDPEDVSWALSTAEATWQRGEHADAIRWLRRAAEAASEAEADDRALELAKAAADLANVGQAPTSLRSPPPLPTGNTNPQLVNPALASSTKPRSVPPRPASVPPPRAGGTAPKAPAALTPTPGPAVVSGTIGGTPARPIPKPSSSSGFRAPTPPRIPIPAKASESVPGVNKPLGASTLRSAVPLGLRAEGRADPASKVTDAPSPPVTSPDVSEFALTAERRAGERYTLNPAETQELDLNSDSLEVAWSVSGPQTRDSDDLEENKTRIGARAYRDEDDRAIPTTGTNRATVEAPEKVAASQAVRVVVWRTQDGVRVAPYGTRVSAISVEAYLVATDPSADLSAWLS